MSMPSEACSDCPDAMIEACSSLQMPQSLPSGCPKHHPTVLSTEKRRSGCAEAPEDGDAAFDLLAIYAIRAATSPSTLSKLTPRTSKSGWSHVIRIASRTRRLANSVESSSD